MGKHTHTYTNKRTRAHTHTRPHLNSRNSFILGRYFLSNLPSAECGGRSDGEGAGEGKGDGGRSRQWHQQWRSSVGRGSRYAHIGHDTRSRNDVNTQRAHRCCCSCCFWCCCFISLRSRQACVDEPPGSNAVCHSLLLCRVSVLRRCWGCPLVFGAARSGVLCCRVFCFILLSMLSARR